MSNPEKLRLSFDVPEGPDIEIQAISVINQVLERLDDAAAQRVIQYTQQRRKHWQAATPEGR